MSKVFMSKRKTVTAVIAVLMTAVIIFGGTFAWQSIQQEALNEVKATVNPGGRLHDDFVEITEEGDYDTMTFNKDIYVENYTSRTNNGVQIFARVRLDEYMEFGTGAGSETDNQARPLIDGASYSDRGTWATLKWDQTYNRPVESPFSEYWSYSWGNEAPIDYMPTFNLDNTSLDPDVNGAIYFDKDGNRVEVAYTDYSKQLAATDPDSVSSKTATATYTPVNNTPAEKDETHTLEQTGTAKIISMDQWINSYNMATGDFWVYDTDGWAYYAKPIDPDFATGLLMTGIARKDNIINEDWYYAINVVAQFITKDDLGEGTDENPGFNRAGEQPTAAALQLLNKIGVDVKFEADSAESLQTALNHGGTVVLTEDVTITAPLTVSADTSLDLNGHTISNTTGIWDNKEDSVKTWSLISVQGAGTELTINGGNFTALKDDCFAVDVRDGARVVINGGTFVGNISAVYVHEGTALINGGNFSIQQLAADATDKYSQVINAYNQNREDGKATITICGGEFVGFNPEKADDGNLVAANYAATESVNSNGAIVYTVTKTVTE